MAKAKKSSYAALLRRANEAERRCAAMIQGHEQMRKELLLEKDRSSRILKDAGVDLIQLTDELRQARHAYRNIFDLVRITKPESIKAIFREALEDVFIRRNVNKPTKQANKLGR